VAPEVLRQNPYDPYLADAWGMGVLLFFMLNGGRYPHDAANTSRNILNHKVRRTNPALPESAKDLINELLEPDPTKRLSVADILTHPWMMVDNKEEDHEYHARRASLSSQVLSVDSSWDESSKTLNITLPIGLSRQEESAFILQHTWRAYRKRQKALVKTQSTLLKGGAITVQKGLASFRIKRMTSLAPSAMLGSRRGSYASPAAAAGLGNSGGGGSLRASDSTLPSGSGGGPSGSPQQPGSQPLKNIMQCNLCGRLPPARVQPGKLPYPTTEYEYDIKTGAFRQEEKKTLLLPDLRKAA
jgi:serine/threonine protein kinase